MGYGQVLVCSGQGSELQLQVSWWELISQAVEFWSVLPWDLMPLLLQTI